jgi:UPF0716 protein FxsA
MRLFGLLVAIMLIEIALFVTVGGRIGLLASLAVIFGTALLGGAVIRASGERTAAQFRATMAGLGEPQGGAIGDQALLMLAGGLLILPGFLGDTVGLSLLLPPVRGLIRDAIARRVQVTERFGVRPGPDVVIDGEFIELDPNKGGEPPRNDGARSSGWTRH